MKLYKNILLAVELENTTDKAPIKRALGLAKQFGAKLSIVHAIEHISSYGAAYGVAVGAEIEELLLENATKDMKKLGNRIDVAETDQILKFGPAKIVILEEAKCMKADLIIVGSHGRHGIRLLLGSTANAVLHAAECDVMAVRVEELQ
ncbi:MAG: universal stress protein [Gammaproteobacteria bacterium]|nr:universal stress protein [Gammaproteobacteria bacterium]